MPLATQPAQANPHLGQSVNVAIIASPSVINGGTFPTGGNPAFAAFAFTNLAVANVNAANLAGFDTALLNVASPGMWCNINNLSAAQKTDLANFVTSGNKLIIYDSECVPQDYSWLPFPFTTSNPGAQGARGTLTIVEDNFLSTLVGDPTCTLGDPHCIHATMLGSQTDAVGDMNVMTTFDPNWCVDMSGTNILNVTGPVHTYAKAPAGTDQGLYIYNGLDVDYLRSNSTPSTTTGAGNLAKIWLQELEQPFDPSNLPCGIKVVQINLDPDSDENEVGQDHTVTATITDLLANPEPGFTVTFTVISGPNAGASGTCSANADCTTDANGDVSWTYTGAGGEGTDEIEGCFTDIAGNVLCDLVTKDWVPPPLIPVDVDIKPGSCPNSFNRHSNGVLPVAIVGTEDFDVTQIDPATVEICSLDEDGEVIGCIGPHEGPPGPHTVVEDVATPFDGELCSCHELEGDGILDLSLKFKTADLVEALQLDALPGGALPELLVRGNLQEEFGETPIEGSDCVRLVPPGSPPGLAQLTSNASGAWIEVSPLDDQLDGGGFAAPFFERSFPQSTQMTVKAAARHKGRAFVGWRVDGGPLTPETNTTLPYVVAGEVHTLEAVYEAPAGGRICGLGVEFALLMPPLMWLYARRRRSRS
jgi:hypothetical protein